MNQLTTGKFILKKRKEKNLTQEQLAEKLGVSNKTISRTFLEIKNLISLQYNPSNLQSLF